ncbi:UDP-glucuronic acid decarboxylase family protein [Aquamicrobium sp. LC103]|uniref:UDP-glucuronic acid decarboxylase family protein n=1 Tax=Aquamicrobium sp. LC103 TaxID=1120658 RepID=UPI00063E9E22|nr:UDP-glucuronic acid decarboxylase family protein [Aquamicrobium sp. LC103]TKT77467.1 SDR family oxidoreductase [Aquamicrobium sp. LC103]
MSGFNTSSGRRILVTGAAGFLGSHLCDRLLASDETTEVLAVDSLFSGARSNLEHLRSHSRFDFMRHDVTMPLFVEVDEIYNLACPASPVHYQFDPIHTMKTSINGAINMLGLAKRTRAKILQSSTSEVYGDPTISPQHEGYLGNVNTMGPRACYDEGKRSAETLFHNYRQLHGVDTRIVRIFNTYGPRMQPEDGRVVSNFIMQALTDQPITVYGDGTHTRSFCYVDDLIDAIVRVMDQPTSDGSPINTGNPHEITINELASTIIDLTGSKSKIVYHPLPQDDPLQRRPDITKAKATLGWEPRISLREGLTRTIAYFEKLLVQANSRQAAE